MKLQDKLNILIPIMSLGRSGGIRVLSELANNWILMGHSVSIVTFYESNAPYFPTNADVIWVDINGNKVVSNKPDYILSHSAYKRIIALYRFLRRNSENFDVVFANHNLTAWPVYFASKSKNFYYIQAYEPFFYSQSDTFKSMILRFLAWSSYLLPLIHVVNSLDYDKYKFINSDKIVFPGLDLKIYYPKELVNKEKDEEFIVGCIGRKEAFKGSNYIGKAIQILHNEGYHNIRLKVAFNALDYKNHELVMPDGDDNLAQYYRNLDILVATGIRKNNAIHYPVIEAMACKTPVITTGYYPSNESNSYIVDPKRPDQIAEAIKAIINNYEIAVKKSEIAYKEVLQFDWEDVSSKFINIFYEEIECKKN